MERSPNSELTRRINEAFILLDKGLVHSEIINRLADRFGTSKIQAYRYLQQAKSNRMRMPIPETSLVFTVKLPPALIKRIKNIAQSQEMSISQTVRRALEDFIAIADHGSRKETS